MKLESYWLDTAPPFAHAAREALEGRADVAIIGGGFTGLSAALALARKGARPVLLEAGRVASEASGRNGGHVGNGLAHSFAAVVAERGLEQAKALYRAFAAAVDTVERIVREEAIDCSFEAGARAGTRIHEHAPVTGAVRRAGRWRLTTPRGTIEADKVLLATGSTTRGPFGWFRRRYVPVGSFIIATEPLGERLLGTVLPSRRTATTSKNIGNYFRLSPDNRLIFGGRARFAMSSPRPDAKSGRILERTMRAIFPQLRDTRIDYCWGGLVDMTADRFARAGEHDGLHFAMGYSGHGVQMSVHMGQVLAEMMQGRPAAHPFAAEWKAIPGHFGPPWFLPLVGAYYKALDRIH